MKKIFFKTDFKKVPYTQLITQENYLYFWPHIKNSSISIFCTALLFAKTSLRCPSQSFFLILIWRSSFWYCCSFPSNSCSILYLFEGHLVLPISLLCQRSRLHLSQTIITAASTAGSKSLVGAGKVKDGRGWRVEEPAGGSWKVWELWRPTAKVGEGSLQGSRSV